MSLIIIAAVIWGICKLISAASAASKERARQAQLERIRREQERVKLEQARQREAWKAAQAAERERVRQMVALEKEQARQAKEQERIAKEQERQAAQLAKHEKRIADLEYRMTEAEASLLQEQTRLDHYTSRLSALDKQLASIDRDIEYYQLAHKVDAENRAKAQRIKVEDKIFSFEEKVRACEKRMSKAQHTIDTAKKELVVA